MLEFQNFPGSMLRDSLESPGHEVAKWCQGHVYTNSSVYNFQNFCFDLEEGGGPLKKNIGSGGGPLKKTLGRGEGH